LNTDGNLIFQGLSDGHFNAYSADKGSLLWSFDAHMGILAAPMTYSVGGQQYVAVLAGEGGGMGETAILGYMGWQWGMPRRLLVFRLGGIAQLASVPLALPAVTPLDDATLTLEPKQVAAGEVLYDEVCTPCHGEAVVANGNAPDLRASRLALDRKTFHRVVVEGKFISEGMPRFDDFSSTEIDALYYFVRARAREDLRSGRSGAAAIIGSEEPEK
jgi:quinohemoprotein ethanol dehydrogenase